MRHNTENLLPPDDLLPVDADLGAAAVELDDDALDADALGLRAGTPTAAAGHVAPLALAVEAEDDDDEDEVVEDAPVGTATPRARTSGDEDISALRRYYRDLATYRVLRPEEEVVRARQIESIELEAWQRLLTSRTLSGPALSAIEAALGTTTPDARRLRGAAAGTKEDRAELAALARRVAVQVRALDLERIALPAAIAAAQESLGGRGRDRHAVADLRAVRRASDKLAQAKHEFVQANLRLVLAIARRFRHHALPLEDLVQEGNLGLMKAVDRFEWRRGFRFSTYAMWWIRHAIQRALVDKGRLVRVPVHQVDSQIRIARVRRELTAKLGRVPTDEEVRVESGIAARKMELLDRVASVHTISLDRPVSGEDDDDRSWHTLVADPEAGEHTAAEALDQEVGRRALREELGRLKPMEADILRQRFGLVGEEEAERTLKEIGDQYGLSRERIRQIEQQALRKLRKALAHHQLV